MALATERQRSPQQPGPKASPGHARRPFSDSSVPPDAPLCFRLPVGLFRAMPPESHLGARMAKAPKKSFVILVNRYALHEFRVDAHSADEACKILQRQLRPHTLNNSDGGSVAAGPFWANPKDKGDEWGVFCATHALSETHADVLAWDGRKVVPSPIPPLAYEDP